jgi:hypothetical protein
MQQAASEDLTHPAHSGTPPRRGFTRGSDGNNIDSLTNSNSGKFLVAAGGYRHV